MKLLQQVSQFGKFDNILIISGETLIYRSGLFCKILRCGIIGKIFKRISDQVYSLANPKEPSYLIEFAYDWVNSKVDCKKIDFMVDSNKLAEKINLFKKQESRLFIYPETYFKGILKKGNSLFKNDDVKYDMVVIVYNDCLGLGFSEIEGFVKKLSKTIIIYNGRHRTFCLTKNTQMHLFVHRKIEKYLIIQLFLVPVFSLIFIFASIDQIKNYLKSRMLIKQNE